MRVRLGEDDFSTISGAERDHAIKEIYLHEGYNDRTFTNDIAIMRLKVAATFNSTIRPICLPPEDLSTVEQKVYVAGWSYFDSCFQKLIG